MSESGTPTSLQDLQERWSADIASARQERRSQRFRSVPREEIVRLALVPSWTQPFAKLCILSRQQSLTKLLQQMTDAGFPIEQAQPGSFETDVPSIPRFAMTSAGRTRALEDYETGVQPVGELLEMLQDIGQRFQSMRQCLRHLPAPLVRWVILAAQAHDGGAMASTFDREIEYALDNRKDAALALNWIEDARPLATVLSRALDERMNLALQRAGRRIELFYREEHDRRDRELLAASFLERPEQIQAFKDLMLGNDDQWALHLIGAGGVGKTMLLRYITAELKKTEWNAVLARVDFDYLNADYPSLAHGTAASEQSPSRKNCASTTSAGRAESTSSSTMPGNTWTTCTIGSALTRRRACRRPPRRRAIFARPSAITYRHSRLWAGASSC